MSEAGRLIRRGMSERAFQADVVREATLRGWLCYHTWRSDHSAAGFPDLILVRGDRIIAAELKSQRGRLSAAQVAWLTALAATGKLETYVWRPVDADAIDKVLA